MSKIESGPIFKFELPFGFGVAYAKLVDFSSLSEYHGITIKVYDFFEDTEIKDISFFKDIQSFMNPLPIAQMPTTRGKYAWKKIGVLKQESDSVIPIYKMPVYDGFAWDTLEKYESIEWNAYVDLRNDVGPVSFDKVRHLEEIFIRSTVTIEKRVVMQLLRYKEIDVKDFFSKNADSDSWKVDYNTQQFIPLYKTIPGPIRGKPLIKGWVPDEYLDWKWE
jgi:hypothetical protein